MKNTMKSLNRIVKMGLSCILVMTIMFFSCGCSQVKADMCAECQEAIPLNSNYCFNCGANTKDIAVQLDYTHGLKATSLLEELLKDDEYIKLRIPYGTDFRSELMANDYDTPIAVYSISKPDGKKLFAELNCLLL